MLVRILFLACSMITSCSEHPDDTTPVRIDDVIASATGVRSYLLVRAWANTDSIEDFGWPSESASRAEKVGPVLSQSQASFLKLALLEPGRGGSRQSEFAPRVGFIFVSGADTVWAEMETVYDYQGWLWSRVGGRRSFGASSVLGVFSLAAELFPNESEGIKLPKTERHWTVELDELRDWYDSAH